jgi:MinD-like ATPase involved in chromosome partitioning or flagellar assembly
MIFTFYSFKGGVGRSMALANVAELLYRAGFDVLMIDFDLEAPGLERFFNGPNVSTSQAEILRSRGVLDVLLSYRTLSALPRLVPAERPAAVVTSEPAAKAIIQTETLAPAALSAFDIPGSADALPGPEVTEPIGNFIVPIYEADPAGGSGSLSLMPAGRRYDDAFSLYAQRVRSFDWEEFYDDWNGEQFLDWFAAILRDRYHVVLIDSRTGITEMSGVCTHHLADAVVLFVGANQQNIDGIKRIATSLGAADLIHKARKGRRLPLLIVPSRIEAGEGDKLDEFGETFTRELTHFIDAKIQFRNSAFVDLKIPYIPFYAYMENVAVREPDKPKSADLITAYSRVTSAMFELLPQESPIYQRYQAWQTKLASTTPRLSFVAAPGDFTGREWVFRQIANWLPTPDQSVLLVTGDLGAGKTALAARVIEMATGRAAKPPDFALSAAQLVLTYACTPETLARSFVEELARALADRLPSFAVALAKAASSLPEATVRVQSRIGTGLGSVSDINITLDTISFGSLSAELAFRHAVLDPFIEVERGGGLGEPIVVLIDAVDATTVRATDNLASLFAATLGSGVLPKFLKFLLFARRDPRVVQVLSGPVLDLSDFCDDTCRDIRTYAEVRLQTVQPLNEARLVADGIVAAAAGNFLYSKVVLDTLLNGLPTGRSILDNIDNVLGTIPSVLQSAFSKAIQQTCGADLQRWAEHYRPLLGIMAAAHDSLTLNQLVGILGRPQSAITDALIVVGQYLRGPIPAGPLRIFHSSFSTFLLSDIQYGVSGMEAHEKIADYFIFEHEGKWAACEDDYALRFTAYHLCAASRATRERRKKIQLLERMTMLLLERDYLLARLGAHPIDELRQDVEGSLAAATESGVPAPAMLARFAEGLEENREFIDRVPSHSLSEFVDKLVLPRAEKATTSSGGEALSTAADGNRADSPEKPATYNSQSMIPEYERQRQETEKLRRSIPFSVRVELNLLERARHVGRVMVTFTSILSAVVIILALLGGRILPLEFWIGQVLLILLICLLVICVQALFMRRPSVRESEYESRAETSTSEDSWERLPEIIDLRAGSRSLLFGNLNIASPYLEISIAISAATALFSSMSPYTGLLPNWLLPYH